MSERDPRVDPEAGRRTLSAMGKYAPSCGPWSMGRLGRYSPVDKADDRPFFEMPNHRRLESLGQNRHRCQTSAGAAGRKRNECERTGCHAMMPQIFIVERPSPGHSKSGMRITTHLLRTIRLMSLTVTGPVPRSDYNSTCRCESVYRLTDEATAQLRTRGLLRKGLINNPCVCDCMGNLL